MTHDEMIAVIRAHEEGKEIQFRQSGSDNIWEDCDPHWAFHCIEYRVRPEAREFYISLYADGTPRHVSSKPFKTQADPVIKVREVLEGEDE
jgi:hypothetical protein